MSDLTKQMSEEELAVNVAHGGDRPINASGAKLKEIEPDNKVSPSIDDMDCSENESDSDDVSELSYSGSSFDSLEEYQKLCEADGPLSPQNARQWWSRTDSNTISTSRGESCTSATTTTAEKRMFWDKQQDNNEDKHSAFGPNGGNEDQDRKHSRSSLRANGATPTDTVTKHIRNSDKGMNIPFPSHIQRAKRPRKRRDETKPLRPLSAYNIFVKVMRQQVDSQDYNVPQHDTKHSSSSFQRIGKMIGQKWKELDPMERQRYELRAQKDRKRYNRELKLWKEARQEARQERLHNFHCNLMGARRIRGNSGLSSSNGDHDAETKRQHASSSSLRIHSQTSREMIPVRSNNNDTALEANQQQVQGTALRIDSQGKIPHLQDSPLHGETPSQHQMYHFPYIAGPSTAAPPFAAATTSLGTAQPLPCPFGPYPPTQPQIWFHPPAASQAPPTGKSQALHAPHTGKSQGVIPRGMVPWGVYPYPHAVVATATATPMFYLPSQPPHQYYPSTSVQPSQDSKRPPQPSSHESLPPPPPPSYQVRYSIQRVRSTRSEEEEEEQEIS